MILNGNRLALTLNGEVVANSVSISLSFNHDLIEVTKSDTDTWVEFIPKQRSISIQFDGLAGNFELREGETVEFFVDVEGTTRYRGQALIESSEVTASTDTATQYSGSLTTIGTVERIDILPLEAQILCINGDSIQINGSKIEIEV